jgi:hypothetical protein
MEQTDFFVKYGMGKNAAVTIEIGVKVSIHCKLSGGF